MPKRSNIREEILIFDPCFEGIYPTVVGKTWQQEHDEDGHIVPILKKQAGRNTGVPQTF